jgi:hypothetical protein
MLAYQRKRNEAKRAGTWQPYANTYRHHACSVDGCERVARYLSPDLCGGHYQQAKRGAEFTPLVPKWGAVDGEKRCTKCGETKSVDLFNRHSGRISAACKACWRIINRSQRLGITFEEAKALGEVKSCAICGHDGGERSLHVDHCHDTGKVRGVLCHNCNTVLTQRNTPEILRRMADYLEGKPI